MKDTITEGNIENEGVNKKTTVLVIYNISKNLTRNHLHEIFNEYGIVKGVYIPKDEETKLLKNYAFIEYDTSNEADKASLYMGEGQIDGLIVRCEVLNPKYYNQRKKSRSRSRDKEDHHNKDDYTLHNNKNDKSNSYNIKKDKDSEKDKEKNKEKLKDKEKDIQSKWKSNQHRKASKSPSSK